MIIDNYQVMTDILKITQWIDDNSKSIIANIDQESIDVYNFIKDEYSATNVVDNLLFQFVFRSFYRLDNAGLTPEFKKEYFAIMQEYRNEAELDFKDVLSRLYAFPNRRGYNTVQFSFVTKLFNTIDGSIPIYDSEVAKMFSMTRPYNKEFEVKLTKYLIQLDRIKEGYRYIRDNDLLKDAIFLFDEVFTKHNLSDMKRLDFIFWSAGKVKGRMERQIM